MPANTGRFPSRALVSALSGVAVALLMAQSPVRASTIYRWVDDQGKTHYAELVPEKYRKAATPLSSSPSNPTEEQQRDARQRAAQDKVRAAETGRAATKPIVASKPGSASSSPTARRPAQVPDAQTDCATWARLYRESLDCFGPYRTTRGATRAEAFRRCNAVEEPPSRCHELLPE
jgi:hypothetical protein